MVDLLDDLLNWKDERKRELPKPEPVSLNHFERRAIATTPKEEKQKRVVREVENPAARLLGESAIPAHLEKADGERPEQAAPQDFRPYREQAMEKPAEPASRKPSFLGNSGALEDLVKEKTARKADISLDEMNSELEAWRSENQGEIAEEGKKNPAERPCAPGSCQMCGKRDPKFKCVKCGSNVCASCYWVMFGLCKRCASNETIRKWREKNNAGTSNLDIKWVGDRTK
ncbi:MAG: hypothetical protein CVT48_03340 [Thermoplasmata archaeon HGW-Thermoplasmata-1]|nr:MAG: hypothetical protein CVT48_03340 [Thermoplasmata archaeon HGW-Thermoplasmata-1]